MVVYISESTRWVVLKEHTKLNIFYWISNVSICIIFALYVIYKKNLLCQQYTICLSENIMQYKLLYFFILILVALHIFLFIKYRNNHSIREGEEVKSLILYTLFAFVLSLNLILLYVLIRKEVLNCFPLIQNQIGSWDSIVAYISVIVFVLLFCDYCIRYVLKTSYLMFTFFGITIILIGSLDTDNWAILVAILLLCNYVFNYDNMKFLYLNLKKYSTVKKNEVPIRARLIKYTILANIFEILFYAIIILTKKYIVTNDPITLGGWRIIIICFIFLVLITIYLKNKKKIESAIIKVFEV